MNEHIQRCEQVLAESVIDVARDLRLVDATELVAWLRGQRFGNIAAVVRSSAELFFKGDALRFAMSGAADLAWSGRLAINLDMEFQHAGVECHFRLYLYDAFVGVGISYLTVKGGPCVSASAADCFRMAMTDARIGWVGGVRTSQRARDTSKRS
jgi:hypothetical protein